MASDFFQLAVYSTKGREFSAEVSSVILPGVDGEIGVLAHHGDYVGVLGVGIVRATTGDGKETRLVATGGFCRFSGTELTILADKVDFEAPTKGNLESAKSPLVIEREQYSLYDPEWSELSQQIGRLEALERL